MLAPRLRFNQAIYEETVTRYVRAGTIWLDAGCGRRILPPWRADAEHALVGTAKLALGCDVDQASMRAHATLTRRIAADLEHLPFRTGTVDLITCNMVVEHLARPPAVFSEFARILKPGGRLIIHTPNAYSYFVVAARLLPSGRLKQRLAKALDGRNESEVFPAHYRANTPRKLRALMEGSGLHEDWYRLVANDAVSARVHPILAAIELLYIRLTLLRPLRLLRVTILASYLKSSEIRA